MWKPVWILTPVLSEVVTRYLENSDISKSIITYLYKVLCAGTLLKMSLSVVVSVLRHSHKKLFPLPSELCTEISNRFLNL